ncbi:MAG: tRNA lysidine(34) synthetase TilS [Deltaproteobacteria bacterium]|nr:tRNA lysidine(34) synthetase TilS [Deltaproteobacteria bacterium]MCK5709205.1 tRNA lysidine(34) synthetase TilS [Deltaproteobacteria bacterium]
MLARVKKTLKKYNMLTQGEKVVLGVSGGADSIAMLYALNELIDYGLELIVAHLNHGIREEEAKRDSDFVKETAKSLGLTFVYGEVDTLKFKEESALSLEDAARTLRYKFFNQVLNKHYATKIATAHTMDDQAETVLMRLLRGSGSKGLSGIPPVSNSIVRPLIDTSRSEVEEYLRSKKVEWVEDTTNESKEFLRNRVRHDLLVELESYNPQIKETLSRTADILRAEEEFISKEALKHFGDIFSPNKSELIGDLKHYRNIDKSLRFSLLRLAIEKITGSLKNISSIHIVSADDFLLSDAASGEVELPQGTVMVKGYDIFLVTKKSELEREFSYTIQTVGKWSFPEFEVELSILKTDTLDENDESVAYFDPETVKFPLQVRNFNPGDRFSPLGMTTSKKLQDYFTDIKLPQFLRSRVPIFICSGEIMWLGGIRLDNRFKITDKNKEVLMIKLIRPRWL